MKLVRFGSEGNEKPGLIDEQGNLCDLSSYLEDISGPNLSEDKLLEISKIDTSKLSNIIYARA